VSLVFIVVSSISVTLAWFAYSGLSKVSTEIGVKAWYIELEKDGQVVSNDVVISLSEVYPGMEIVDEKINIKNLGDSDAQVKYSIVSARILGKEEDNYFVSESTTSPYVEDLLSHNYPFHININLDRGYVLSKGEDNVFEVSVSWPLDSDNDEFDSYWGIEAFKFQENEDNLKLLDPEYQVRPAIEVVISVIAEQYLESDTSSDPNYNLGDTIYYDVVNNAPCIEVSSTCLKSYVLDVNNKTIDSTVTLLPDPTNTLVSSTFSDYSSSFSSLVSTWTVTNRALEVDDALNIISLDIINSLLVRENISDSIIGNLSYDNRIITEKTKAITYNGYYKYLNESFNYLSSSTCYWTNTEYDASNGFALKEIDTTYSKLYNEPKTTSCKVVPVIIVNKT
jgi:hypothetical protein